jgi:hypothetical protein
MKWDRTADLRRIGIPTLTIGARHDTMDPAHMEAMARVCRAGAIWIVPTAASSVPLHQLAASFELTARGGEVGIARFEVLVGAAGAAVEQQQFDARIVADAFGPDLECCREAS